MGTEIRRASTDPADLSLTATMRLRFLADVDGEAVESLPQPLAEDGGECVGIVSVVLQTLPPRESDLRTTEGYVINMYVEPGHRGVGLGRRLLDAAMGAGPELGIRRWTLVATDDGRPLYERVGFTPNPSWMEMRAPS